MNWTLWTKRKEFLLTRLLRGATLLSVNSLKITQFLLTRLLRGATFWYSSLEKNLKISTHAPLARRDVFKKMKGDKYDISTHAPLARRDSFSQVG